MQQRCEWAKSELSIVYHAREWGVPVHSDRTLFEFLTLDYLLRFDASCRNGQ